MKPVATALALAAIAGSAHADLVLQGPMNFQGTGLGAVNTVLTIQSPGNGSFESGSVGRTLGNPADVISGDAKTGASQTLTRTIGELGITSAADLRVVFNASEPQNAGAQSILLNDLRLSIYSADGAVLFTSGPFTPVNFADTFNGTGNSGFVFALNAAQAAQAQAAAFGGSFESNRIGLTASAANATGGLETFFIANATPPVPEPASTAMLAAGLGVVGWFTRRRRTR